MGVDGLDEAITDYSDGFEDRVIAANRNAVGALAGGPDHGRRSAGPAGPRNHDRGGRGQREGRGAVAVADRAVLQRRVHRLQRRAGAAGRSDPGRAAAGRAGQAAQVHRRSSGHDSTGQARRGDHAGADDQSRARDAVESRGRARAGRQRVLRRWGAGAVQEIRGGRLRGALRRVHRTDGAVRRVPADGGAAQSARRFPPAAGALRVWVEAIWRRDRRRRR